jgi:hypothetical protein
VSLPSSGKSQPFSVADIGGPTFPQLGHETAEGCEAPHESLNVFNIPDLTHFGDGQNLVRVGFDVALSDVVPQVVTPGDSEGAFLRVQLNVESSEVAEGFFQVGDEAIALSRLCHDVVNINLEVAPYLLFEAKLHAPPICSSHVFSLKNIFTIQKQLNGVINKVAGWSALARGIW